MKGILSTEDLDDKSLVAKAKSSQGLVGRDLVREVIPESPIEWDEQLSSWAKMPGEGSSGSNEYFHVVALDFGMMGNIARHLADLGRRVTVLPGTATASDVLEHQPDGLFLSNGPGDPEPVTYAIETIGQLMPQLPVFQHTSRSCHARFSRAALVFRSAVSAENLIFKCILNASILCSSSQ